MAEISSRGLISQSSDWVVTEAMLHNDELTFITREGPINYQRHGMRQGECAELDMLRAQMEAVRTLMRLADGGAIGADYWHEITRAIHNT